MKKLSEQDALTLAGLVDRNGVDAVTAELKRSKRKKAGRPSDLILNTAILWAHIEFLKLHRVIGKKRKLESACELLADYLDRYTVGGRSKSEVTLKNIYKSARNAAAGEPLIEIVMHDAYAVLLENLGTEPKKIPIPYLIEGVSAGLKFPTVDRHQFGDNMEIVGCNGPKYSAAFSMIVTPKNN